MLTLYKECNLALYKEYIWLCIKSYMPWSVLRSYFILLCIEELYGLFLIEKYMFCSVLRSMCFLCFGAYASSVLEYMFALYWGVYVCSLLKSICFALYWGVYVFALLNIIFCSVLKSICFGYVFRSYMFCSVLRSTFLLCVKDYMLALYWSIC